MKVISYIEAGRYHLKEFQNKVEPDNDSVFKAIVKYLVNSNIGQLSEKDKTISFSRSDKIRIALIAIRNGCDIQECSRLLSWQDFESLTSQILGHFEYDTKVNIVLTKPRCQLDVIAIKKDFLISIDCKHWKNYSKSAIMPYVDKQIIRTKIYLSNNKKIKKALPMLLTLYDSNFKFINGTPIVPISFFKSFIFEFESFNDNIAYISR
jgi:hypothetical protein